jgi:amino acid transporter
MSAFATYLIGYFVVIVGLAIGSYLLNVPTIWVAVGVIVLVGLGILTASSKTRQKDPPAN